MKNTLAYSVLLSLLVFSLSAHASLIVEVTSITYTGTNAEFNSGDFADENDIINGSGLSAPATMANIDSVTHSISGSANRWVTTDPNGGSGDFFAVAGSQGSVIFEILFDKTYSVTDLYSWTYSQGNTAKAFTIDYGVGDFAGGSLSVALGTPPSLTGNGEVAQSVPAVFTADRVQLTVTDNYYDGAGPILGGDRAGLAELRFVAVPEASSVALLALGGLALMLRRRR